MKRMRRSLVVIGCLVLAGSVAHADESPLDVKLRRAVLSAIKNRDARAFANQVNKLPLRLYHVWFDAPACAKEFGGKVSVEQARVPALVGCLARLGLADGKDGSLVHAPGVAVVPLIYRGKLAGLSGVAVDPTTPTVTDEALSANLAGGALDVAPDAATRAALDGAKDRATVWLEACVDARGKIENVSAKRTSSDRAASYAKTIQAAATSWTFRPFKRAGKPIRVCLQRPYAYPPE
jgi:hypothetical protein